MTSAVGGASFNGFISPAASNVRSGGTRDAAQVDAETRANARRPEVEAQNDQAREVNRVEAGAPSLDQIQRAASSGQTRGSFLNISA